MKNIAVSKSRIYEVRALHDGYLESGNLKKAFDLAIKNMRVASRLHLFDAALDFAVTCRRFSALVNTDSVKLKRYQEKVRHYRRLRDLDEYAEDLFTEFGFQANKKKGSKLNPTIISEFERLLQGELTFSVAYLSYYALILYYTDKDKLRAKNLCEQALDYFENIGFSVVAPKRIFAFTLMPIYIEEEEFEDADSCIYYPKHLPKGR